MPTRTATLRALAKINLTLKVLHKRPHDGFHELRTVFQTISLADTIRIAFTSGRTSSIELLSDVDIPNNLATRAAEAVFEQSNAKGHLTIELQKKIPMGGGLGGGSSDAAAILLALPVLMRRPIPMAALLNMAADLGSDVPFFLAGGTALGLGRGEELYPFPEPPYRHGILITPGVHVSTPDAFRRLNRTADVVSSGRFQVSGWDLNWPEFCENDFESVVFPMHPRIKAAKLALRRSGAAIALMTGSGSSVFGLFATRPERDACLQKLGIEAQPIRLVNRSNYRRMWKRMLSESVAPR